MTNLIPATEPEGSAYTPAEVAAWGMSCPRCGNHFTDQRGTAMTCDVCNHYVDIKPSVNPAPPAERAFHFVSGFCTGFAAGVLAAFYMGGRK